VLQRDQVAPAKPVSRRYAPSRTTPTGEQKFSRLLAGGSEIVIDCLSGMLRYFEPDGLPGLLLSYRRAIDCIPTRSDIIDLEGDDIAPAQFAIDG
jgi:hypothetical protein